MVCETDAGEGYQCYQCYQSYQCYRQRKIRRATWEGERADKGPVLWMAHWTGNSVVRATTRGSVAGGTLGPRLVTCVAFRYQLTSPIDWRRLELAVAVQCCLLVTVAVRCRLLVTVAVRCRLLVTVAVRCCRLVTVAVRCCRLVTVAVRCCLLFWLVPVPVDEHAAYPVWSSHVRWDSAYKRGLSFRNIVQF